MSKLILIFFLLSSVSMANESEFIPYVLKKGDNVTEVMREHALKPIYGKGEKVEQVLKLNRLNYASAKKLEVGDVILLPIKSKVFSNKDYEDRVSTLKSSIQKQALKIFQLEAIKEKVHNFYVGGGYFNQDQNFKNQDINIQQNFIGKLGYLKKDLTNRNLKFQPSIEFGTFTQSQAAFSGNRNINADFNPSFFVSTEFEVKVVDWNLGVKGIAGLERFSAIGQENEKFVVNDNQLTWVGLGVKKYLTIKNLKVFYAGDYSIANTYSGTRLVNQFGMLFKHKNQISLSNTTLNMKFGNQTTLNRLGLNYAYFF